MPLPNLTSRIAILQPRPQPGWRALRSLTANLPLTATALASLGLVLVAAAGLAVDPRVITGMPAWVKPMKFGLSFAIYSLSLIWLLSFVRGHARLVGLIGGLTALGALAEMMIITLQVVRGTSSHFNESTPLDTALWQAMGASIVPIWLMGLLLAVLLTFQRLPDPAFAWALRWGVIISLVGMVLALPMTATTPRQRESPISGAHSVGVDDGGPGLPFVGWSTEGGDLRVAHFAGLHGLQALPLAGYLVNGLGRRLGNRHRTALVWLAAAAYLGLVFLLFWQALRGQPVTAPDAQTLAAFAALAAAFGLSACLIVVHARSARPGGSA